MLAVFAAMNTMQHRDQRRSRSGSANTKPFERAEEVLEVALLGLGWRSRASLLRNISSISRMSGSTRAGSSTRTQIVPSEVEGAAGRLARACSRYSRWNQKCGARSFGISPTIRNVRSTGKTVPLQRDRVADLPAVLLRACRARRSRRRGARGSPRAPPARSRSRAKTPPIVVGLDREVREGDALLLLEDAAEPGPARRRDHARHRAHLLQVGVGQRIDEARPRCARRCACSSRAVRGSRSCRRASCAASTRARSRARSRRR